MRSEDGKLKAVVVGRSDSSWKDKVRGDTDKEVPDAGTSVLSERGDRIQDGAQSHDGGEEVDDVDEVFWSLEMHTSFVALFRSTAAVFLTLCALFDGLFWELKSKKKTKKQL